MIKLDCVPKAPHPTTLGKIRQARGQVGIQVWSHVENQVVDQIVGQVWSHVGIQVVDQIRIQVRNKVRIQV